jgi:branched-chain amino acid transport system substrate-binding protein
MEEKIMKNKFVLSLCILILVVMFSVSCFAAEKILFAIVAPMTGAVASAGLQYESAAKLAVEEINTSGGVNGKELEYIVGDDMANPNQAVLVAEKFSANKDILFVLGHNDSGNSIAALPTWEKAGIPVISPCNTNPTITRLGHKNYFRIMPNDDLMVDQLVKLAVLELGFKNLAVLWANSDYGRAMYEAAVRSVPEMGAKIVVEGSFLDNVDRDFATHITKFKGAGADCVLFLGAYTEAALFISQAKKMAYNVITLGSSGVSGPKLIEIAGEASEGTYVACGFDPNDKRPKQAEFIKKFEAIHGTKPGEWGAHAYDVVYIVAKAIEMGGTTREKLIEVLHRDDFEYDGVTGLTKFDEYGDVPGKNFTILKVEGGEFTTFVPTKF